MKVLILSPDSAPIADIVKSGHCEIELYNDPISPQFIQTGKFDITISYRYRHIIRENVIQAAQGNIINLHISLLPWNRGSDPNLWSFLEDTPKGCTIHYIDSGVDTGDIITQKELFFEENKETLATTYSKLNTTIIKMFELEWPHILAGTNSRLPQESGGSVHRSRDKKQYENLWAEKKWNTPVHELVGAALQKNRGAISK